MGIKSYSIVGYTSSSGEFLCPDCSDLRPIEELAPVFADDEFDYYPTCDNCGSVCTDIILTREGVRLELEGIGHKLLNLAYNMEQNRDLDVREALDEIMGNLSRIMENT